MKQPSRQQNLVMEWQNLCSPEIWEKDCHEDIPANRGMRILLFESHWYLLCTMHTIRAIVLFFSYQVHHHALLSVDYSI